MNDLLKLFRKSKTAKAGIVTIVWGILLLFGLDGIEPPAETIDDLGNTNSQLILKLIGAGAAASGLITIKGRNDAEKKIKEKDNG